MIYSINVSKIYTIALFFVIFISGILIGFADKPIIYRTLLIDFLVISTSIVVFVFCKAKFKIPSGNINVLFLFSIYAALLLLHSLIIQTDVKAQVSTYRMIVFYPLFFALFSYSIFNILGVKRLALYLNYCFSAVSLFAIIQFVFSGTLPENLLTINNERAFGFYGVDIIRPTGLIGNTIIFSGFLLMGVALSYTCCFVYGKKNYYFLAVILTANFLTYSRASFVGAVLTMLIIFCIYKKLSLIRLFFLAAVSVVSVYVVLSFFNDSLFIERLTDQNASSQGSTDTHIRESLNALTSIYENPFTGIGLGTQGPSYSGNLTKIITDGFFFQLFVEQGIFIGGFFLLICTYSVLYVFKKLNDAMYENPFFVSFFSLSLVFIPISILNSSLYNQINYLLLWLFFFFCNLNHVFEDDD